MTLHVVLIIISALLDVISLALYFHIFLFRSKKKAPVPFIILAFIGAEIGLSVLSELTLPNTSVFMILLRLTYSLASTFLLTLLFETTLTIRIVLTISFHGLYSLSEITAGFIIQYLLGVKPQNPDYYADIISIGTYPVLFLLMTILLIFKNRIKKNAALSYPLLLLITPIITVFSVFNRNICEISIQHPGSYIAFVICLLFINYVNYLLLDISMKTANDKEYYRHIQQQNEYQKNKYEQLSISYRKMQSYHHDTKKQLLFIKDCLNEKNYDAILPYMEDSLENLSKSYSRIQSGNLVIDSFLSNYQLLAEQNRIHFETNISVDNSLIPIYDYDFSILLGNLLDNAMNACLKIGNTDNRSIQIHVLTDNTSDQLIVHIINSLPQNESSEPINELIHGYGLSNAEECVKKYCGIFRTRQTETEYEATAIIPLLPPVNIKKNHR